MLDGVLLRRMEMEDLQCVLKNERKAYQFPWTEGIFKSCLCNGDECWIILDKKILGHAVLSFAAQEAHLLNLCIHPEHQNKGLGKQALDHVVTIAKKKRCDLYFFRGKGIKCFRCILVRKCRFQ